MYCVKCGVELADSERKCPLCGTAVYHPEIKQKKIDGSFPKYDVNREEFNREGILFILTVLFIIPILITSLSDFSLNSEITWSGYVIGSVILTYVMIVLPLWFRRPNPVIFVPVDFAVIGLFLLYINLKVNGHWFLTLAFPIVGILMLILSSVIALTRYLKKGYLYIYGGALIACGGYNMLIEFFVDITFNFQKGFSWSLYPLTILSFLGITLLIIAVCKPLKESLYKKFFL